MKWQINTTHTGILPDGHIQVRTWEPASPYCWNCQCNQQNSGDPMFWSIKLWRNNYFLFSLEWYLFGNWIHLEIVLCVFISHDLEILLLLLLLEFVNHFTSNGILKLRILLFLLYFLISACSLLFHHVTPVKIPCFGCITHGNLQFYYFDHPATLLPAVMYFFYAREYHGFWGLPSFKAMLVAESTRYLGFNTTSNSRV